MSTRTCRGSDPGGCSRGVGVLDLDVAGMLGSFDLVVDRDVPPARERRGRWPEAAGGLQMTHRARTDPDSPPGWGNGGLPRYSSLQRHESRTGVGATATDARHSKQRMP